MPTGHESRLMRDAFRGFINRSNGHGRERIPGTLAVDQRLNIHGMMLLSRTRYKNSDGTPFVPQFPDGSFPPIAGLDFPPPKT